MQRNTFEYWTVRRDYAGELFIRLNLDLLKDDYGTPITEALTTFLGAHYAFNDLEDPPSAVERDDLITTMEQAKLVLGALNPYLFVDSLIALEQSVT